MTTLSDLQTTFRFLEQQEAALLLSLSAMGECAAPDILRSAFEPVVSAHYQAWKTLGHAVGGYEYEGQEDKKIADDLFNDVIDKIATDLESLSWNTH